MDKKTVYVDFDGTVVDVWERYYGITQDYVSSLGSDVLIDFEKYKKLKRNRLKDHEIIKCLAEVDIDINSYMSFKLEELEKRYRLKADIVIGNPLHAYQTLRTAGYEVKLLTQRYNKENLIWEINYLRLQNAFDELIVVKPRKHENVKLKYLKERVGKHDVIIGDSPAEMECGRILGITGIFVKSGLFSRDIVKQEQISETYIEWVEKL